MKILLAHNSLYFPSHGGGDKSNRLLMEALAARGHQVEVFARLEDFSEAGHSRFLTELHARDTPVEALRDGGVCFRRNGVSVFTVTTDPRLRIAFAKLIADFAPDIILCSTDDPGALLLEVALRAPHARVVYLVRATVAVPFGPDCAFPNPSKTAMIGTVDSVVGVSEYVAAYVRQWSGFPAVHVPISLLEPGDYSAMGRFENEFVLMVNPCAVKGISIFTALAAELPGTAFAAVPTWGTNPEDLAALQRHPNIHIFDPVDDIAVLLRRTRVVLVPSVWAEARSRMVVEAMVRGIPVIASDVGGLHEAKLGVEYLLPVNPIQHYRARVDANMVPVAEVPPQDIQPWLAALGRLLTDPAHYANISRRSRDAALHYTETLHAGWLDEHLRQVAAEPAKRVPGPVSAPALSPTKKKLLALRLEQHRRGQAQRSPEGQPEDFFPRLASALRQPRLLFCFPWAGAGASAFRLWLDFLEGFGVCPVRLPGRETRLAENHFIDLPALVRGLLPAIQPHLDRPFAFYGHSMGAGVAFELTRALRHRNLPLPVALLVASARAPQLRSAPPTGLDPSDAELLAHLRSLGGLPEHEASAQLALPALRADTHLYRHYLYSPEPPLPVPIHAFYGFPDPSLSPDQVRAWSHQSTAAFSFTELPGGHLFPLAQPEAALAAVRRALLPHPLF